MGTILFYAGSVPAQAVSTYVPESRPYRIALEGWTIVGMGDDARTAYLSFDNAERAEEILPMVREQIPDAVVEMLAMRQEQTP